MKYAGLAWAAALILLGAYEGWAFSTGGQTLSAWVWTVDLGAYGRILPLLAGVLVGHFFVVDMASTLALAFGIVGGAWFWGREQP